MHKKDQEQIKAELQGLYQDFDLVFAQPNGRPTEVRLIDRAFEKFISENDLQKVVFHSLRHLSTSEKLKVSGGDIKAVQGDTGHSQASMVTDVYSHIFDADRKRIVALMETSLFSDQSSGTKDVKPEDILNRLQNATPEMQKALFTILGL